MGFYNYGGNPQAGGNGGDTVQTGVYSNGKHVGNSLNNATIQNGGVEIYAQGSLSNTQLNGGSITINGNGTMTDTDVRGGAVYVHAGTAVSTIIRDKGKITVAYGGHASRTTVHSLCSAIIGSGGMMTYINIAGGTVNVQKGGTAVGASLGRGATINVAAGAAAYYTMVGNNCSLTLSRNVTESGTIVYGGGVLDILPGAVANGIDVDGTAYVSSSATVNGAAVGGKMFVLNGAVVNSANVSGAIYLSNGATLNGLGLTGKLYASTGARVSRAIIAGTGSAYIASKANIYNADVIYYGTMYLSGGAVASTVNVSGGVLRADSGTTVNGLTVRNYPHYESYYVSGGSVSSRLSLTPNGTAYVSGKVTNATVISGGKLYVGKGAVVTNLGVSGSASASIGSGAKLTGAMSFVSMTSTVVISGATTTIQLNPNVQITSGAEINFDIRKVVPNKISPSKTPYRLTGASYLSSLSAPNFTITINVKQELGVYRLMDASFVNGAVITVSTANEKVASVTLNKQTKTFYYGNLSYTLSRVGTLTVASRAVVVSITADVTKPTKGDVKVSATFGKYAAKKQYSIDNGKWLNYSKAVTMKANGTVYFRALDADGNVSNIESYEVTNIDKVAPNAPKVKLSTTKPTNQSVTITATFTKDTAKCEISCDKKKWTALSIPSDASKKDEFKVSVPVSQNVTCYIRAIDAVGNVSKITTVKVANIDKVAPNAPKAKADTTKPTNRNVKVTATFSSDTAVKGYSFDKKTWKSYTGAVTMKDNGKVYFRGIDAAGNASKVTEYKVTNIDRVAPDAPTVKANTTKLTNQNVTITAKFSKDTAKKQYSTDNKNWKSCSGSVTVNSNGTFYFRGIDAAGNASKVASIKVSNIDKVAPEAPKVKASTTKPTNQDVTLTATFSKEAVINGYSFNNKTWSICTGTVTVKQNGTVYFRSLDAAGNVSKITTVKVANIDKTAPDAPKVKLSTTKATDKSVTVTATFSSDSKTKQYSTDQKTWKTYSKALTAKANGTYYFRAADAAGNVSKVASVKVANIVDTANNSWADATKLAGSVNAALDDKLDKVDYYDVGDVAKLMLDMEAGKAKVTFCGSDKKAASTKVSFADGSEKTLSSLTLVCSDKASDNITLSDLGDAVKYLRIESAAASASYKLAKLA